jgi:hypothetical protein
VWPTGHSFTGDAESQREPGTQPYQVGSGVRFGVDTDPRRGLCEGARVPARGQHIKGHSVRSLADGQSGQSAPAGHQNGTGRNSGEQRSDLFGGSGIVEDNQEASPAEQGPVEALLVIPAGRDAFGCHVQRPEKAVEDLIRFGRTTGIVTMKVRVEVPAGEPILPQMGPVDGQGGLTDASSTGDRRDQRGRRANRGFREQQLVKLGEFGFPVREVCAVGRQLLRRWERPHRCPVDVQTTVDLPGLHDHLGRARKVISGIPLLAARRQIRPFHVASPPPCSRNVSRPESCRTQAGHRTGRHISNRSSAFAGRPSWVRRLKVGIPRSTASRRRVSSASSWASLSPAPARLICRASISPSQPSRSASAMRAIVAYGDGLPPPGGLIPFPLTPGSPGGIGSTDP